MNGNVSEPSEALLDGGLGSSEYGYYVGADNVRAGSVVLDFRNSKIRFASPKMLSNSCLSESNSGGGQMILDFENSVIRSTGDATKLFGGDNSNYRSRDGCKFIGSSFLGASYDKYFQESGSVPSAGESSSGCFVGAQRDASVASPFQTNYRQARLSRGESNAETDIGLSSFFRLFDMNNNVFAPRQKRVPSVLKSLGRKRARSVNMVGTAVEADNFNLSNGYNGVDMNSNVFDPRQKRVPSVLKSLGRKRARSVNIVGTAVEADNFNLLDGYNGGVTLRGKVVSQWPRDPPNEVKELFRDKGFQENIRAYNQMFAMTSFGACIDDSVNKRRGPYVFKISGQIYHWIGSLCPEPGNPPRFLQLYIYDTQNEVANRIHHFTEDNSSQLDPEIVSSLIRVLDEHNELVQLFRTARDRIEVGAIPDFRIRIFNVVRVREYDLPTSGTLGVIVFESGPNTITDYDVIIESRNGFPQRVNKLHPLYMSLQFPLLFVYAARAARGDREGSKIDGRIILPRTFTGGPHYMYSHYLDALAICRVLGNPQHFITFTCNVNWPEIKRHMQRLSGLTTADRAGVVKHGLRHCHTLLWVKPKDKIQNASDIDRYISAELPDPETDPQGYGVVSEMMVHGPCGPLNSEAGTEKIGAKIVRTVGESPSETDNASIKRDEIQNFIDGRFICPHEACWRILEYEIHSRQPAVQILSVHLENIQSVTFKDSQPLISITFAKNSCGIRTLKAAGDDNEELRGCKTFEDIRTVNKRLYPTFRAACEALGLLGDDKEWHTALEEAAFSATSQQLRSLFAQILIFCDVADPLRLWKSYWRKMSDDVPRTVSDSLHIKYLYMNDPELEGGALYELEVILNTFSKTVSDFGLPPLSKKIRDELKNKELMEEKSYNRVELAREVSFSVPKLNTEQGTIYDMVLGAATANKQEMIFVYGHGGTGKTFLWKTLINTMQSQGKIVLAVASSGITSLLLPAGRTAHSRFKLPLDLTDESLCNIKKNTHAASLLAKTSLIIWDESPMNDRRCFEALDRTLRDILDAPDILFRGKTIFLGGDFRQTLPVKKGASKSKIVCASIAESELWHHFKICKLKENMRLMQPGLSKDEKKRATNFASWLLEIGDGKIGTVEEKSEDNMTANCISDLKPGAKNKILEAKSVRFTCKDTITNVNTSRDWYYQSCNDCFMKVTGRNGEAYCVNHGLQKTGYRYNFKAFLTDESATALVTFFTPNADVLTGSSCTQLVKKYGVPDPRDFRDEILSLNGRTHIFQVHYNPSCVKGRVDLYFDDILYKPLQIAGPSQIEEIPTDPLPVGTPTQLTGISDSAQTITVTPLPTTPKTPGTYPRAIALIKTTPGTTEGQSSDTPDPVAKTTTKNIKRALFGQQPPVESKKKE
ncbi:DNA helicase [Tanacetum coccineum]